MEIKSINVVLDSSEVATAIIPMLDAKLASLGKVAGMQLADVPVTVTFAPEVVAT